MVLVTLWLTCGGGSAANTITAVAQLGSSAFYSCKVANDKTGEYFLDDLAASGVLTNLSKNTLHEGHTGKCIVLVTPDAERSMNTFLGITREISVAELDETALQNSQYVYIEGYLVPEVNARAAAVKARQVAQAAGVKTALTLSDPNMVNFFKDPLLEIIGDGLDMVFSNEEEARLMFDADSLEDAVTAMKGVARQFAITRGANGALVFDGKQLHEIPAEKITPVDSNGAGDIYAGAFMHGLTNGMAFTTCAELAGAAATTLVQQMGARLNNEQMQVAGGQYWRIISSGFLHGSILHIGFNMYLLFMLGPQLEQRYGSLRFSLLYFGSLFGGALAVLVFGFTQPTLGASGAVLGLAGAMFIALWGEGLNPRQSPVFGLVILNLALPLLVPGISFWGHLGGVAAGALLAWLLVWLPRKSQASKPSNNVSQATALVVLMAAGCLAVPQIMVG